MDVPFPSCRGDCSETAAFDFLSVCPVDVLRNGSLFEENVTNFAIFCSGIKLHWIRYGAYQANLGHIYSKGVKTSFLSPVQVELMKARALL